MQYIGEQQKGRGFETNGTFIEPITSRVYWPQNVFLMLREAMS